MSRTLLVLALILVIAGQLVVLSSFHQVNNQGFSVSNAIVTVAKLGYVNAKITLSVVPMVTNGTSQVEIIFPSGNSINLTTTNGATPKVYTQTFSLPRTGNGFGNQESGISGGNNSVFLTQDNPFMVSLKFDVDDPQSYFLTHSLQDMQVSTFIIYGRASIFISGYGVAL